MRQAGLTRRVSDRTVVRTVRSQRPLNHVGPNRCLPGVNDAEEANPILEPHLQGG